MQTCFLTINKDTQVASYLQHRSILEIVSEHRSLSELDLDKLEIIDVDKFLYIYYSTDDNDSSFRVDMNILRNIIHSAFFHIDSALFILVDNKNPLLEDLIKAALRDSDLSSDKLEIIQHTGSLMMSDVGKYISGSTIGQSTSSTYKDVYIREADKEEKDRYMNISSDLSSVLPVLTDMSALYAQRASVESISSSIEVSESIKRFSFVKGFSKLDIQDVSSLDSFVISGDRWSNSFMAVVYFLSYFKSIGKRCLIINLNDEIDLQKYIDNVCIFNLMDIKFSVSTEKPNCLINVRYDNFSYLIQFIRNIKGVEKYIFYTSDDIFKEISGFVKQLSEHVRTTFISHYNEQSIKKYLARGLNSDSLFLNFDILFEEFDLKKYKSDFEGTVVAKFPTEDVDYIEFYSFVIGGGNNE